MRVQESDLCMWSWTWDSPDRRNVTVWSGVKKSSFFFFLVHEWEERWIILQGLRSENEFKGLVIVINRNRFGLGQNHPGYCLSLGCFALFLQHFFFTTLFRCRTELNSLCVEKVIFPVKVWKETDCTTPPVVTIHAAKMDYFLLRSAGVTQASLPGYRFLLFMVIFSLSAFLPSRLCLSYPLSFLYLRLPPFSHSAWRNDSRAHWPGGRVPWCQHRTTELLAPSELHF